MSGPHAPEEPCPRELAPRPRRRVARVVLSVLVFFACLQPLAQALSRYDWRADLLSHFPEPALLFTLIVFGIAVRCRSRVAIVLAALVVWQTAMVFRYARPNPVSSAPAATARLKILMANVLIDNGRYEDLARLIRRERPDVVGLIEYTRAWQDGLRDVRAEFAHTAEHPAGASGLALWFRERPLSVDAPARLRPKDRPFLHARLQFGGRERQLWLLHPRQPLDVVARYPGNPELAALAEQIARTGGSAIVVGDLNTSDGSGNFHALLRATGLRDSRYGFGRQGSFPTFSPYRIAIDHALVSRDLAVVERRLGPSIGSDHYPLLVEFAPALGVSSESSSVRSASQSSP